jgi:hypothetical protein
MMMEMSNKIFQTCRVDPVELEEHLNDLAEEGRWVLHSVHPTQMGGSTEEQLFTVITYAPYDWVAAEIRAQERLDGVDAKAAAKERLDKLIKEAYQPWTPTGGHANE